MGDPQMDGVEWNIPFKWMITGWYMTQETSVSSMIFPAINLR